MKNNIYYETLGIHLERFIVRKWNTKTRAGKILDVSANRISEMISGARPPNNGVILKLARFGFDIIHYERWLGIDNIQPDNLTKKEVIDLLADAKLLIRQQAEVIKILKDQLGSGK